MINKEDSKRVIELALQNGAMIDLVTFLDVFPTEPLAICGVAKLLNVNFSNGTTVNEDMLADLKEKDPKTAETFNDYAQQFNMRDAQDILLDCSSVFVRMDGKEREGFLKMLFEAQGDEE